MLFINKDLLLKRPAYLHSPLKPVHTAQDPVT